ncbi:putative plant bZIP transcription factor [Helianthus anomalus]
MFLRNIISWDLDATKYHAYTMELEAEVSELKQKNQELKRKQEELLKMQKNQIMEMMNMKPGAKRNRLKKTISGPW